jgi:poly(3-hydroxybutyrate) depolymerase
MLQLTRFSAALSCLCYMLGSTAPGWAADAVGAILGKPGSTTGAPYGYMLYLPDSYNADASRRFPLVVCLNGIGEIGNGSSNNTLTESDSNQLARVLHGGPLRHISQGSTYFNDNPAIVVQPQTPDNWNTTKLNDTLTQIASAYRTDVDRLYVTGYSLGGGGAWGFARNFPDKIAALAPICGSAYPAYNYNYTAMNKLTIWSFHGDSDTTVRTTWTVGSQSSFSPSSKALLGWMGYIARTQANPTPSPWALDAHPNNPTADRNGSDEPTSLRGITATRTGRYTVGTGWRWIDGSVFTPGDRLQTTIYVNTGHDSWTPTYGSDGNLNRTFWDWLLAQRRNQTPVGSGTADIIVDNLETARTTVVGNWGTFTNARDYGDNFAYGAPGTSFTFTPDLPRAGTYRLYIWYTGGTDRDKAVPVTISANGTQTLLFVDQRTKAGQWVALGTYACASGTGNSITLSVAGTSGRVIADAVRFLESPGAALNTPPALTGIADVTLPASGSQNVTLTLVDAESAAGELALQAQSDDSNLLPDSGLSLSGTGTNRTLSITPIAGATGSTVVTVTVQDPGGLSSFQKFSVTVNAPAGNTPPTIAPISDQVLTAGVASTQLSVSIGDAEPGSLTLAVSTSNAAVLPLSSIALGGSGNARTLGITPPATSSGSAMITVRVTDAGGLSAATSFEVTVNAPGNLPPTISAIPDQNLVEGVASAAIAITVSDPENTAVVLSAEAQNDLLLPTAAFAFSGSGNARTLTISPPIAGGGSTSLLVRVTDANGSSASRTCLVTVTTPLSGGSTTSGGGSTTSGNSPNEADSSKSGNCGLGSSLAYLTASIGICFYLRRK